MMVVRNAQEKHVTNLLQTSVNRELSCSHPQAGARSPNLRTLPRAGKQPDPHTQVGVRTINPKTLLIAGRQLDPDCDIATVCRVQGHPQIVYILF